MFAVYFLLLLPTISAQVTGIGRCPTPYVPPDFKINEFLGTWYEIARIPNNLFPGKCVRGTYSLADGGNIVIQRISQFINNQWLTYEPKLTMKDRSQPARLEHQLVQGGPFVPFLILHCDYKTYAILFVCENHAFTHSQYAWIIARSPTLDQSIVNGVIKELKKQGIHADSMMLADQSCHTTKH